MSKPPEWVPVLTVSSGLTATTVCAVLRRFINKPGANEMDAPIYLASKEGNSLTPEQQWDKVRLVTELAEKVW